MNTLNKRRLLNDLKDLESRRLFYAEHIANALPIQSRELRKKRRLTQSALAKLVGTNQKNISDWENPNYEYRPQIGTLMRLADAFDVPLIVRFGSWEELCDWETNLSPERLAPHDFDEALPTLEKNIAQAEMIAGNQTKGSLKVIKGTPKIKMTRKKGKAMQAPSSTQRRFNFNLIGLPSTPHKEWPRKNHSFHQQLPKNLYHQDSSRYAVK